MQLLCGVFDLISCNYSDDSENVYSYCTEDANIYILGNVRINESTNSGEDILQAYRRHGTDLTNSLRGLYILVIYDKVLKAVSVFQDRTTSPLTLYYSVYKDKLFLSTSIKKILLKSDMERCFNDAVLPVFLINGFIYGKDTLIKGIYKIESFHMLQCSEKRISQIPVTYNLKTMSKGEAVDSWTSVLNSSIQNCIDNNKEINMPLSGGFDSNYIAYVIDTFQNLPINAFSIGGKFGKNELPVVSENVNYYKNVTLFSALTDNKTLQNMPDIVWRLEGAVFESGLFLQYALSKLVNEQEKHTLICGECADQVMNIYYLNENRIHPEKQNNKPLYYEFSEYPYIFGSYLILKKNGIIANSFDITTSYPYLDDDFVAIAFALRNINFKDKRVHNAICRESLPEQVYKNISKVGGSTECHSLFNSTQDIKTFFSRIESNHFYKKHNLVITECSAAHKEEQHGLQKTKTIIRNRLLNMLRIDRQERLAGQYYLEELKLKEYLCILYLILFEELFLSGKYDKQMKDNIFQEKLDELF